MFRSALCICVLGLAGCGSLSVPVTGFVGDQPAQGEATAKLSGAGTFWVMTTSGLRCEGIYDSITTRPTITSPVECSDGRSGTAIITRTMDQVSGTVIARLTDGTEGRFVFGNLQFDQAFARTNPTR